MFDDIVEQFGGDGERQVGRRASSELGPEGGAVTQFRCLHHRSSREA
ncbi:MULTISPECIES: hypothetical protein [unclassified Frankia]